MNGNPVGCLQAQEVELQGAYAKLTAASTERGKLRAQLINAEASAAPTHKLATVF